MNKIFLVRVVLTILLVTVANNVSAQSSSTQVFKNAFIEFLVKPNADLSIGKVKVYKDGRNGAFDCNDCSAEYTFDTTRVRTELGGVSYKIPPVDYASVADQLAKVVVDNQGNVLEIEFFEFTIMDKDRGEPLR